ncbi:YbhB/YbcL family Raf kinase inhibitor-like protein [Nakamurella lactea]|uniref:YbhB/YbcL family Raf kinase inhibitor-like protein n=1 Tax=Nakamurella lactea TaxID=459515 RepID=UPI000418D624|nr:YbhB/YbcL family Raf kinase inhibitor-like protein [Nakamurella lactea]
MTTVSPRALGPLAVLALLAAAGCGGATDTAGGAPSAGPQAGTGVIAVSSTAFADGAEIPAANTCRGAGQPPPLRWSGVPPAATSLALVVDDPDAPGGTFVHWALLGIPAAVDQLNGATPPVGATALTNSAGHAGWTPPCPPSGTHHYRFTVYALGASAPDTAGVATLNLTKIVATQSIASGRLTGLVTAG